MVLILRETVYDYLERRDHSLMSMPEEITLSHLNEYDFFSKLSSQLTSQGHSESQGKTKSAKVCLPLLPPISDHVIIQLGGYFSLIFEYSRALSGV